MTFEQALNELSALEGRLVLFQIRSPNAKRSVFELLDVIDRVDSDAGGGRYVVFFNAESSASLEPEEFRDAAWEPGWRLGEEDERLLRIRLGETDLGFLPS